MGVTLFIDVGLEKILCMDRFPNLSEIDFEGDFEVDEDGRHYMLQRPDWAEVTLPYSRLDILAVAGYPICTDDEDNTVGKIEADAFSDLSRGLIRVINSKDRLADLSDEDLSSKLTGRATMVRVGWSAAKVKEAAMSLLFLVTTAKKMGVPVYWI